MNKVLLLFTVFCLLSCKTKLVDDSAIEPELEPIIEAVYDTRKNPEVPNSQGVVNIGKFRISDKGASVLNQLFTTNEANTAVVIVVKNESDCDFIMDIKGQTKSYSLPVSSKKEETIVVDKGDYELRTDICNSQYISKRKLIENTQLVLKHSTVILPNK